MYLMNCPSPIYDGEVDLAGVQIIGFTLNYTVTYGNTTEGDGTFFDCYLDPITGAFSATITYKPYGTASFFDVIPIGWLGYVADFLTNIFERVQSMLVLISMFVSPTGFNILGITIDDLSGYALMLLISIYALCYISIGSMIYKVLSPFSGVG